MADLGTIGIAIEVRGREALRQIESDMTAVDRTAKSAARSFEAFERAGLKTADTFKYVSEAAKRRLTDEQNITRELIKQRDAAEKLAKANAQAFQAQIGGNLGLGARGISAASSASVMETEIERLRLKFDAAYAGGQLFEQQLQEINAANRLGVLTDQQREQSVAELTARFQQFEKAVAAGDAGALRRFAQGLQDSQKGLARYGVVMQQTGYQVGDFLVQVQSGTNAFVAFGQQATQLAGLLTMSMNPKIVAAGAALSILIPLATAFGAAWTRTSEKVKDGAKDQEDAIKALDQTLKQYLRTKEAAASGFTPDQKTAIEELNEAQKESIAANQRLTELGYFQNQNSKALLGNSAAAVGTAIALVFQSGKVADALERQASAQELVNTLRNKMLETYEEESRRLAESTRLEEARIRFGEDSFTYKQLLAEEDRKAYERSLQTLDISEGYVRALMAQYDAAVKNRKEVQDTRDKAKSLMDLLERFHGSEFQAILKVKADVPDFMEDIRNKLEAIEGGFDPNNIPKPRRAPNDIDADLPPEVRNTGDGRGVDPLESLINQLQTEQETLQNWYTTSQEMLQSASDAELGILGGKYEAMARLDEEYRQRAFEAQQAQAQMSFQAYSGMFSALGDLLSVFGNESKGAAIAALAIQKGLAVAQIVVSTAAAQMRAFAELGPIAGAAMAAKIGALGKIQAGLVIATGLAQAANIGRGTVGGVGSARGSATVSTQASAPAPQTVMIDSIDPDSLYSGQTLINLFDAFYNENDKRGKVFVVAR